MKLAIVGGGASGMIAAYLLDRQGHQVTVYEKEAVLGGHIRTLNQNIPQSPNCPEYLETGVLEFPVEFRHFLQLMQELEIPLAPVQVGSGLFFRDGRRFLSPVMIDQNVRGWQRWRELLQVESLYARSAGLWIKTHRSTPDQLRGSPLSDYLQPETPRTIWLKLLTMYSYSMPYETMDHFPAELAIPALRRYIFSHWVRIRGGVYSYIEKILQRFSGTVMVNAEIHRIDRSGSSVFIQGCIAHQENFQTSFDRVIFATPPDQVLPLLADPSPSEVRRFRGWRRNDATTILHCDRQIYDAYGIRQGSEFDFFQTSTGWGYNATLNQMCGVTSGVPYSLAFNLQEAIDPEKIIHRQRHHTPYYDVDAMQYRSDVIAHNGCHKTYYVGAYLGDGLHEGAVVSALRVAEAIGPAQWADASLSAQAALVR
ncbi:FAD-dependent oxidoreductase [Lyngbya confervoides]|uniref:FAD-dependent oxidoreductase n=1 Tax=Lyngbya confervoides BDU141951 TaxID=1574623 RepID=A0ABD4SYU8_9CYAN|nr:FAD-dependent oxidoreductase [Lyngbya confervoides]MCM1981647.1 FAD-dependent oxidoreductase [Lyngbya confervoides BDU141951]